MRRGLKTLTVIAVLCAVWLSAGSAAAPEPRIDTATAEQLDSLLKQLQKKHAGMSEKIKALAAAYVGAPYCTDPLTDEAANWFPYDKPNCTMLVLYVTALANSTSVAEAREHMRRLHYRGGQVGFATRYHFTADRITDPHNRYFTDITAQCVSAPAALRRVTLTLNKTAAGSAFFAGRLSGWQRQVTVRYLPREGFSKEMLQGVPEVVGIAFLKRSNWPLGVLVGHEGLLVDGDLYHASPVKGVVVVPDYFAGPFAASAWEGVMLFSINSVALGNKPNK